MTDLFNKEAPVAEDYYLKLATLNKLSKLYGYKIPEEDTAKDLVDFLNRVFPNVSAEQLFEAFDMVAQKKLNVNLEAYGRILIAPLLSNVLNAYLRHKNLTRKRIPQSSSSSENLMNARLATLHELETIGELRQLHYMVVDKYVYRFKDQEKIDEYKKQVQILRDKLNSMAPVTRDDFRLLRQALDDSFFAADAKVNAKVALVTRYVKEEIIDYVSAEERIKNNQTIE